MGTLAEVECAQVLYLGEVVGGRDAQLIVTIEHAVQRAAAAAVREVWQAQHEA
jgi:hypothetical protein